MRRWIPTGMLIGLLLPSCAKKEASYESAMRDWAGKMCSCCQLEYPASNECVDKLTRPEFPDHFLDNMMTNPNHEVTATFERQTRACCDNTNK